MDTRYLFCIYSVVITWLSNPPISQFNNLCNEFTSVWSLFLYNIIYKISSSSLCTLLNMTSHHTVKKYNIKSWIIHLVNIVQSKVICCVYAYTCGWKLNCHFISCFYWQLLITAWLYGFPTCVEMCLMV